MRARLLFIMLGFAALVACGGGGGGGGNPIVNPTPTPTPAPTPTPTPLPTNNVSRPAAAGDMFAYSGTTTTTFVRPPQVNGVLPSPNPTNSQTLSYTTTQTQSVATNRTYNGNTAATAFTTVESDTLAGGLSTMTTTSTEYYAFTLASGMTQIRDLGGTSSTSTGVSYATLFGANNGLVDILPETAGPVGPANDAAFKRTETDADGSSSSRTTNADGTYTENGGYIDGTKFTAVANADGSGTFSFPLLEPTNALFAVGAPVGSTIPITITYPAGYITTPNATPTPTVVKRTVTVWYPQPLVLATQTLVDTGSTAVPSACNVPAALVRSSANAIVSTVSTVDPLFGELDKRVSTTFTEPGVGVACVQLQDVLQQFYDFSEQTGQVVATRSTPVQTTTTTQMLGLTSETVIGLSSVGRLPAIAASRARFFATLDRARTQRHAAAVRAMRAFSLGKGGR